MRKILLPLFILLSFNSYGQDDNIYLHWEENDSLLYFNHASFDDFVDALPVFNKTIPWHSKVSIPNVSINIVSSSAIDSNFLHFFNNRSLSSEPKITYQLVYEQKKPILQIKLEPFFTSRETGQIERIESFILNITESTPLAALKSAKKNSYSSNSVLASKAWYKVATKHSGIHKLSYEQLEDIGLTPPQNTKIYGAGAIQLPENYSNGFYDDLQEIPVYYHKGSDNVFGPGDYLLFYAQGICDWEYDIGDDFYKHNLHPYANEGYYFLTNEMGIPGDPPNVELSNEEADFVVNSYDQLHYYEEDKYNLLHSGREWYSEEYEILLTGTHTFELDNIKSDIPVKVQITAAGRSNENSSILVKANNASLGSLSFSTVNLSSHTSTYAIEKSEIFAYNTESNIISIVTEYNAPNSNSSAYLNHISINARASLSLSEDEIDFRDHESASFGAISEFKLSGANTNTIIWEITDKTSIKNVPYTLSGSIASFKISSDNIREFIAFNPEGSFPSPRYNGNGLDLVENQNLHGSSPPDMLIVYADIFKDQAERLAEHRRSHDELDVMLVTEQEIFNEFSSGTPNISALRNFLKMYYDNYELEEIPQYLLLFGDGSYANRDTSSSNTNYIMTYQSSNSLTPTSSYVSDDFYGLLDNGEQLYDGLLDIGIGRLPVSNVDAAEEVVDKLIAYDQLSTIGEWRNYICFIGDDEDGNIHMRQANSLANDVSNAYPNYNINKIMMDAYVQQSTATGDRYPDVTKALNDQMNRGALIVNYTGHGGMSGLAHERILEISHIKAWRNEGMWPLFMTATCEFSRYDEYDHIDNEEVISPGEEVILNPIGGAIALFTTTRLVYSGPNHTLNEKFYEIVFEKDENGKCYKLGDIIKYSKNKAGAGLNKRNFTLLGDPATSLSFPKQFIITDSINNADIQASSDTISALEFVSISGHFEDSKGNLLDTFNGNVIPIVYDKESNITTLSNDGGSSLTFQSRNHILYKGNASVNNGAFDFNFYVPLDIGYNIGGGKISYYGYNESTDAHGSTDQITIGGLGETMEMDTVGPKIRLFMNDSLFKDGGIVNPDPELLIYVEDPYGINTTGNGIGHDITATLDSNRSNSITLNEYYKSTLNSYSSGTVRYPYTDLEPGEHNIEVKVWDIFNNSATENLNFVVVENMNMLLEKIYTYPNPFTETTWFNIEHNRPDQNLEFVIKIYDLSGNLLTIIQENIYADGYRINPPSWNGTGYGGATLGGGIYVYTVTVQNDSGEKATGSGRIIIKR